MIRLNFYEDGLLITKREEVPDSRNGRWTSVSTMVDFRTTTTRQFAHQLSQALQEAGVECELNEGLLEEVVTGELNIPDDFDAEYEEDYTNTREYRDTEMELLSLNEIEIDRDLTEEEELRRDQLLDQLEEISRGNF